MKTIMAILCVLPSLGSAQTMNQICIGERCGGQRVSWGYIQNHPILKSAEGSIVKSFSLSYSLNSTVYEKRMNGNNLTEALPFLRKVSLNQKFYVDNVQVAFSDGKTIKTGTSFTMEEYTNTDQIYWGIYSNGDEITATEGSRMTLRYIDNKYEVVSFAMSYESNICMWEKLVSGNRIPSDVPLGRLKKGQRVYFDRIKLRNINNPGDIITKSAVFIIK